MAGVLRDLGLYGLDALEVPLLAALALGEPALLVGGHGGAKTTLCRRVAEALGLRFWAYDASKSLFEDVLGFPDPGSLVRGEVRYVPTPISIWGKQCLLIDELSRASPAMQSKWLEVIRSRQIMGHPLPGLELVLAAMNPPTYLGAHPLDEALAGRFAVVLQVPDVRDMGPEDVLAIVRNVTEEDAPALRPGRSRRPRRRPAGAAGHPALRDLLQRVRRRVRRAGEPTRAALAVYVAALGRELGRRELPLDGRRLGMLWRVLLAALCVHAEREGGAVPFSRAGDRLLAAVPAGLPFAAVGRELSPPLLRAAHEAALSEAAGERRLGGFTLPPDPAQAVAAFEAHHQRVDEEERRALLTRLLARADEERQPERRAPALVALGRLARRLGEGALTLEPDDQFRVLERFRRAAVVTREETEGALGALRTLAREQPHRRPDGARVLTSIRLALRAAQDDSRACVEPDDVARRSEGVEVLLGREEERR